MRAGEIHSRGGYAQAGTQLQPGDAQALAGCEGLVLRLAGDGQAYSVLLTTGKPCLGFEGLGIISEGAGDGQAYSVLMTTGASAVQGFWG